MSKTIDYYNNNTEDFINGTINADVSSLYEKFLTRIPAGGRILDFGCGSGRDTKFFKDNGYQIDAIDGSYELCQAATKYSGVQVRCMDFFDFNEKALYDGIWACASLLHVDKEKLPTIISRLSVALKPDGILYMSFKYGDYNGIRDGRFFQDLDEVSFKNVISTINGIEVLEQWQSEDVRRDKTVSWLNEIIRRKS